MSLAAGTSLEHYEILAPLGAGGMGEVFRALDSKLRREVASGERKPIPLVAAEFNQRGARFSPDGRFFSYLSNESGTDGVYVQTFDPAAASGSHAAGGKWMISKGGGLSAHLRTDGKEIFYLAPNGDMMAVDVTTAPSFQPGVPRRLFNPRASSRYWDVTGSGQRFLLPVAVNENAAAPYTVVLNWMSLLKR
jgi:hypothetical protein